MAAPRISVRDDGSWKTVNQPHVRDGDVWKGIHNVWLRDANAWKLAHKTAIGQYSAGATTRWEGSSSGGTHWHTYTVPDDGTRYLRVTIVGQSGGGGGGARTFGDHSGKHHTCSYTSEGLVAYSYVGGTGGAARHYEIGLEVKAGETYQGEFWNVGGYGTQGGKGGDSQALYLSTSLSPIVSAGTQVCGDTGGMPFDTKFKDWLLSYTLNIVVNGGAGGPGACVKVQSNCSNSSGYGYDLPGSGTGEGAQGATGNISIQDTGSRIVETYTNGAHAAYSWEAYGPGSGGVYTTPGSDGRDGYISITAYK